MVGRGTPHSFSILYGFLLFLRWWCFKRREQRHCRWSFCLLIRPSFTHSPESSRCLRAAPKNEPLLSASPAWLVQAGLLRTPIRGLMKFWSLLCQYYDLWSLGSNSSFPFKCALLATPSPSTPGESYLFHNWFVKQLKRLTSKGILVSFVSGIRCFNAAPPPQCLHNTGSVQGCEGDEGRPTINFIQCTLHCHHTFVDTVTVTLIVLILPYKIDKSV